ncbi:hypothetical protein AAFF_G00046050, partial [Aldrovandia affinis]
MEEVPIWQPHWLFVIAVLFSHSELLNHSSCSMRNDLAARRACLCLHRPALSVRMHELTLAAAPTSRLALEKWPLVLHLARSLTCQSIRDSVLMGFYLYACIYAESKIQPCSIMFFVCLRCDVKMAQSHCFA